MFNTVNIRMWGNNETSYWELGEVELLEQVAVLPQ